MSYAGPTTRPITSPTLRPRPDGKTAFITGVALGAAIGAGVALLLAPRSGRATRRKLARNYRGYRKSLRRREASSL